MTQNVFAAARRQDGSVVMVGAGGSAVLIDATGLASATPSGTALDLYGCAVIDGVAWACGGSFADGSQVILSGLAEAPRARRSEASSPLLAIWGAGSSRVWAVGVGGQIVYFDGSVFAAQASGTSAGLQGIWGADASHVWVVGEAGTILFYDGGSWTPQASGTSAALRGVWGTDASHVWAVGESIVLFFDGASWTKQYAAPAGSPAAFYAIAGRSATDIFACGADFASGNYAALRSLDGATWTSTFAPLFSGQSLAFYAAATFGSGYVLAGIGGERALV